MDSAQTYIVIMEKLKYLFILMLVIQITKSVDVEYSGAILFNVDKLLFNEVIGRH